MTKTVEVQQIVFSYNVPLSSGVILREKCPLTGTIKRAIVHFPDGCNGLVEVSQFINQEQVFPSWGVIALNNTTETFRVERGVVKGQSLRVRIDNKDALNPHKPSLTLEVEGVS